MNTATINGVVLDSSAGLQRFFDLTDQFRAEAKATGDEQLTQEVKAFTDQYLVDDQSLPREPRELLSAQILLRKVLRGRRCYDTVYAWYMCFKYPYGIDQDWFVENIYKPQLSSVVLRDGWIRGFDTVLEVGCGAAAMGLVLAKQNGQWIATDVCRDTHLNCLIESYDPGFNFSFEIADAIDLQNFEDESVDVVVSSDMFEHLLEDDAIRHVAEMHRVLRPDGIGIIKTPAGIGSPADATHKFPEYDTPLGLHIHEYRLAEVRQILLDVGFTKVRNKLFRVRQLDALSPRIQRLNFAPPLVGSTLESIANLTWKPVHRSMTLRRYWHRFWCRLGVSSLYLIAFKGSHWPPLRQ